ncbi:DUF6481 family protein [Sphingomonas sp. BN140010]|uniref:DUF6481 family protein n=1 Tax=Sphingomonas arvum TaxID=2992113 RepID=A0ABT3JBM6_9SPHN|nr:DUF6481 family protein [Sphingomonas sp. BN140010]MCW3796452.1 DUF6481 family protein [Sphingomonas sp. BN140010]
MAFKNPTFQDRAAQAADARAKALEKLRNKPPVDPAVAAERLAAAERKQAVQAEKAAAKKAEAQAKAEAAAEAKAAAAAKAAKPVLTEAEKKAARDARYAARKARR